MADLQQTSIEKHLARLVAVGLTSPIALARDIASVDTLTKVQGLLVSELNVLTNAAIHGCSFGVLQEILKTGHLPASIIKEEYHRGYLDVEPIIDVIGNHTDARNALRKGYAHFSEAPNEYHGYAENHALLQAESNALIKIFGLNPTSYQDYQLAIHLVDSTAMDQEITSTAEFLVKRGFTEEQIDVAKDFALNLKGFCIGLKPEVFLHAKYSEVASDGRAPRLKVPKEGIPLELISGIQPMGEAERMLVRQIKML